MAKIPKEVQEFLKGKMAWVATAASDGMPNTTPKGSVKIIDDEHIVVADLFSEDARKPPGQSQSRGHGRGHDHLQGLPDQRFGRNTGVRTAFRTNGRGDKEGSDEVAPTPVRCPNHGGSRLRPVCGARSRKANRVIEY